MRALDFRVEQLSLVTQGDAHNHSRIWSYAKIMLYILTLTFLPTHGSCLLQGCASLHHHVPHQLHQVLTSFQIHLSTLTASSDNMARGPTAVMSGMASNPYPRPKEHAPMFTTCELCDRKMPTKDWNGHKNSKKHRTAEAKEKEANEPAKANDFGGGDFNGFQVDTSGFTADNTFASSTANAGDGGWGADDFTTAGANTSSYGNTNNGGGGDRACYGCGQTGHQKRDCPSGGGGGGGDRACYGCGQTGHQKRDCPSGGGGGSQACFNCGEEGYVDSSPL